MLLAGGGYAGPSACESRWVCWITQVMDLIGNGPVKICIRRDRIQAMFDYFQAWKIKRLQHTALQDGTLPPEFQPPKPRQAAGIATLLKVMKKSLETPKFQDSMRRCFIQVVFSARTRTQPCCSLGMCVCRCRHTQKLYISPLVSLLLFRWAFGRALMISLSSTHQPRRAPSSKSFHRLSLQTMRFQWARSQLSWH